MAILKEKMWYVHRMEYYLAKMNEGLMLRHGRIFEKVLRESSQSEQITRCMAFTLYGSVYM